MIWGEPDVSLLNSIRTYQSIDLLGVDVIEGGDSRFDLMLIGSKDERKGQKG